MKKLLLSLFLFPLLSSAQDINTIAGTGATGFNTGSYSGDGGPATAAHLFCPSGMVFDKHHNLIFADCYNNRIRKISTTGMITTIAGGGTTGLGDGGPATSAQLSYPSWVTLDSVGNIFIADAGNNLIRKVDSAGIITTVAGSSPGGFSGDGGPALDAELLNPDYIIFDTHGNLYIADWQNNRLRKVNTSGIITTIAGNGTIAYSGDGVPATSTGLSIGGFIFDPHGNILFADMESGRIRKIDTAGIIYTLDSGLTDPSMVIYDDAGNLVVPNENAQTIVKIDTATGAITTIAGTADYQGFSGDGGAATAAELSEPESIVFDSCGALYISDLWNNRIRRVIYDTACTITTSGLSVGTVSAGTLRVYPSPADDELNITASGIISTIGITNITGQQVYAGNYSTSQVQVNVSALPAGIYFVKINDTEVRKFVKE